MAKYRQHKDPKARLARLKARIAKERRDEAGNLHRKWSAVEDEIAQIEAALKSGKSDSK